IEDLTYIEAASLTGSQSHEAFSVLPASNSCYSVCSTTQLQRNLLVLPGTSESLKELSFSSFQYWFNRTSHKYCPSSTNRTSRYGSFVFSQVSISSILARTMTARRRSNSSDRQSTSSSSQSSSLAPALRTRFAATNCWLFRQSPR